MSEAQYTRLTYDLTMGFARTLARLNPGMIFCYVTGAGTDSTEKGRVMWARVKGRTENELLKLPFKAAYMFRPGFIRPMRGVRSSTPLYAVLIALGRPLFPLLMRFPEEGDQQRQGGEGHAQGDAGRLSEAPCGEHGYQSPGGLGQAPESHLGIVGECIFPDAGWEVPRMIRQWMLLASIACLGCSEEDSGSPMPENAPVPAQ